MTGINKKRLMIWGVIFLIFLAIGGGGFALSYVGYGNTGKVRTEVSNYIDKFNKLDQVRTINKDNNKLIKASLSDTGITVDYKNNAIKSKVYFTYKEENGLKYLDVVYNSNDLSQEEVIKLMIDAVGVENGNIEGSIFKSFDYSDFYATQLAQGVHLTKVNNSIDAKINLKANILSITDFGGGEETITYILVDDTAKDVNSYITYTVPNKFTKSDNKYELSTDSNTCTATFRILSKETAATATALVESMKKADNATSETKSINGANWYNVVSQSTQGGQTNRFLADTEDGGILLFDYTSMYANSECDEYLDSIINTLKLK